MPIAWSARSKPAWAAASTRVKRRKSTPSPRARSLSGSGEHLDAVTREQRDQRFGVLAVARLDQEFDFGGLDRGGAEHALMLHLHDVAARFGDQRRHLGEAAG